MRLHRQRSFLGSRCFTGGVSSLGVLGVMALVCAACSLDESEPNGTAPSSTAPASGGATGPSAGATAAGNAPGTAAPVNTGTAANEAPNPSALQPPAGQDATGARDADAGGVPEVPAPSSDGGAATPEEPEIDPSQDENLAFILEDGFETTYFSVHCSALGDDGSEIDGDTVTELPVGGGYILQCNLDRLPSRATTDVLSAADEPWCALGELQSFETGGDERLDIVLVSQPDTPSPVLIATRQGDPITLQLASAFGAPLWPVWLVTNYDAVEVARAEQGKLCDQVFGL